MKKVYCENLLPGKLNVFKLKLRVWRFFMQPSDYHEASDIIVALSFMNLVVIPGSFRITLSYM